MTVDTSTIAGRGLANPFISPIEALFKQSTASWARFIAGRASSSSLSATPLIWAALLARWVVCSSSRFAFSYSPAAMLLSCVTTAIILLVSSCIYLTITILSSSCCLSFSTSVLVLSIVDKPIFNQFCWLRRASTFLLRNDL